MNRQIADFGLGLGWRSELAWAIERHHGLGFLEVVAEDLDADAPIPEPIERLKQRGLTIIPHGVTLSLGGAEPADRARMAALGRLATRFLEKAYSAGEVVFHEGDPGRALFVVVEGTVEITQATPGGEHLVRTLGAGDAFGELALLDESRRSRSARVAAPARLLILYKTDFDALIDGEARIAVVVMRNLSRLLAAYARSNPVVVSEPGPGPGAAEPT